MKKVLLIISAFMLAGLTVHAQGSAKQEPPHKPPTVEERLKHLKEVMVKDASLNVEKQQEISEVFKQFFIKADKLNPPPPPPNKAEMDKLVKERDDAIAKILTADEFKRFKEAEKKLRPPHPPQPREGEGAPPPPRD